jgi:hypothetical protein
MLLNRCGRPVGSHAARHVALCRADFHDRLQMAEGGCPCRRNRRHFALVQERIWPAGMERSVSSAGRRWTARCRRPRPAALGGSSSPAGPGGADATGYAVRRSGGVTAQNEAEVRHMCPILLEAVLRRTRCKRSLADRFSIGEALRRIERTKPTAGVESCARSQKTLASAVHQRPSSPDTVPIAASCSRQRRAGSKLPFSSCSVTASASARAASSALPAARSTSARWTSIPAREVRSSLPASARLASRANAVASSLRCSRTSKRAFAIFQAGMSPPRARWLSSSARASPSRPWSTRAC